MARPKKETNDETNETTLSPEQIGASFLKNNKEDHLNFEESIHYKVPASSLKLSSIMNGGLTPGAHRHIGWTETGKTSQAFDFMYHFLKSKSSRRGIYVKAEGRLSEQLKARSGIEFTTEISEWKDGTCFVLESNVYEAVFGFFGQLIKNNPSKTKFFLIIDSMDMMARKDDLAKSIGEANQVAGGALLTSTFLKQTSAALAKRGHIAIFISQVRDSIKINMYEKVAPRLGMSSGGHALEHAPDWVFEYGRATGDDIIRENPADKNSRPIGHYCKVKIVKSPNETTGQTFSYPVKYGRVGGKSVWVEREIADLLIEWALVEKGGAWFKCSENFLADLKKQGFEFPEKIQGFDNLCKELENNQKIINYLFDKFSKQIFA